MKEDSERVEAPKIPPWKRVVHINRGVSVVETVLNDCGGALILLLMFGAVSEIVGRRLFDSPIRGYIEISELIMAGVVFFGIAFTQRIGGHVRVELLIKSVLKGRLYHMAESFTLLLSLFIFAIIIVGSLEFALYSREVGDVTSILYLCTWPSQLCIPIACSLLCVRLVIQLIQHLSRLAVRTEGAVDVGSQG